MITQLYKNKPHTVQVPLYGCVEGFTQRDAALFSSLRNIVQRQAALQRLVRGQDNKTKQSEEQQLNNERILIRNEQINNQLAEERGGAARTFQLLPVS